MTGAGSAAQAARPGYFAGKVSLEELSSGWSGAACKAYRVRFAPGARTKIHAHTGAQALIPIRGAGVLELFARKGRGAGQFGIRKIGEEKLEVGGAAHVPPGVLHAHGSGGKWFAHVAVNFFAGGAEPETAWYESDFKSRVTARI